MAGLETIICGVDASGAARAARQGLLVMIVDVIDMSTSLESALDAGAYAVLGASPDHSRAPVDRSPEKIGREAARLAGEAGGGIVIVAEPRFGDNIERRVRCRRLIDSIEKAGGRIDALVPNGGLETRNLTDFRNQVAVAVTDTGGVAFDAAFYFSPLVTTGTIARACYDGEGRLMNGYQSALRAVERVRSMLKDSRADGIAVIAASRKALEDLQAAQYICNLLTEHL